MSDFLCIRCGVFPVPTKYVICEHCTLDRPMLQLDPTTGTVSVVGRDPELRKAALEALCAMEAHLGDCGDCEEGSRLDKALDALRDTLAKS